MSSNDEQRHPGDSVNKMRIENQDIVTEDLFETIIENFPDIIHSVDEQGRIIMTNLKASTLLGYSRRELMSKSVREIYAADVQDELDEGFAALRESGDISVESVLVDQEGNRIPVEIRSFSIYDDAGKFRRTFSIIRDIRVVKELQRGLIAAERLAAVGEMASGILHDINNPLTVIRGCSDLIRHGLNSDKMESDPEGHTADLQSYAADIERASKAIEKLSYHLRLFARGVEEEHERFDLYDCVSDAIFLTGAKIRDSSVRLNAEIDPESHYVFGCRSKVEQIFVNLISNACDAMIKAPTRELSVDIERVEEDAQPFCRVQVRDTGSGIPAELHDKIFESFFTTKDRRNGTGLGLAIARGVVNEHGGRIEMESTPDAGTTFRVYLPAHDQETQT